MNLRQRLLAKTYGAAVIHLSGYLPLYYALHKCHQSDSHQPLVWGFAGYIILNGIAVLTIIHVRSAVRRYQASTNIETPQDIESGKTIETLVQPPDVKS